jgi:hypothetical protein
MAPPSDDDWFEFINTSTTLTPKSKASYCKHVRSVRKLCCENCTLSQVMFDPECALKKLQRLPPSVQRPHIAAILSLFKRGEEKNLYRRCDPHVAAPHRQWLEALSQCHRAINHHLDDNQYSQREIEAAASLSQWVDAHKEMQRTDPGSQAALLVAFQTLALPPLRGSDLSHIRIGYQPTGNYFMVCEDGTGELVIRDHKTARYYPKLERHIPPALVQMALESHESQPRNWLFSTRSGGSYSPSGFLKWKSGVFQRAFHGRPVTSNSLRHAFVTERVHGNPNLSTNQARAIASSMGHSLGMQRQYVRLNPPVRHLHSGFS